jgi:hypothetical protein
MTNIAIIDPASYSLPYDYFYLMEVSNYYKVDFYYSQTKYNYEYIEKLKTNQNINLIEYSISTSVTSKFKGFFNYLKMLFEINKRKNKYCKIHFMWNLFLPIEKPFFKMFNKKFIFTFHNNTPHNFKGKCYKPYEIINQIAYKKIFVSEYTKKQFLDSYSNTGKYYLLNHGLMPVFNSLEYKNITKEINKEICFWGRVEEYKGVDIFIDFLHDIDIKIYGKWNSDLKSIREQLNSKKNIQIFDEYIILDDLIKLLESEIIFILPYKDATQSGVLYTFLAHEKIFISSNVGENSEFLLKNDLSALIFDRNDEESVKKAIEYAVKNYWYIKEKFRIIRNKYKWENIITADIIKEIYDK